MTDAAIIAVCAVSLVLSVLSFWLSTKTIRTAQHALKRIEALEKRPIDPAASVINSLNDRLKQITNIRRNT